jgi:transposase
MDTATDRAPHDWREYRRFRVWEMHRQGYAQQPIADALGLTQSGVSRVLARARDGGQEALCHRQAPGPQPRLTAAQRAGVLDCLTRGAEAFGFLGDVWTCGRIAQVIEQECGVHYHPDYIGPLLRSWGWSPQRPQVRATQRNAVAVAEWQGERLPGMKKKRTPRGTPNCSSTSRPSTSCPG